MEIRGQLIRKPKFPLKKKLKFDQNKEECLNLKGLQPILSPLKKGRRGLETKEIWESSQGV